MASGGSIAGGFLRLGRHTAYMLGKMRSVIDAHSAALENLKVDGGDEPYPNAEGGLTFQGGGGSGSNLPPCTTANYLLVVTVIPSDGVIPEHLEWREGTLKAIADEA